MDSVRAHLVSDVPVGAFLSAGIDSGALVGLMCDLGYDPIHTVTLGFQEFAGKPEDEVPLAESVGRRYGTQQTTRIIGQREFLEDWPRILEAMDQPSVDGANTWLVSKVAHEVGLKVVLSGVGETSSSAAIPPSGRFRHGPVRCAVSGPFRWLRPVVIS